MGKQQCGGRAERSARPIHINWADNSAGMRVFRKRTGTAGTSSDFVDNRQAGQTYPPPFCTNWVRGIRL